MDEQVRAAMARWPDVPAAYGWLSLTGQGQWRLQGEPISNTQLLRFIDANYGGDAQGRWFFQNGPQRVYVTLDAAPYILRTQGQGLALLTHNGRSVGGVDAWWLDDAGRLYAQTDLGPGLVCGRDTLAVLETLRDIHGTPLLERLEHDPASFPVLLSAEAGGGKPEARAAPVPLRTCPAPDIPRMLGFQRRPQA